MSRSFFLSGNTVHFIANADGADLRYRAGSHYVPPHETVPARINHGGETILVVEHGTLEFMVGGATAIVAAGGHVRVPRGVACGYRNLGDETAHLLARSMAPIRTGRRVTIDLAAG